MEKRAVISDVHSNLEALEAVLADIDAQGITEIICLGDIVGYGPNPRECIDRVMNVTVCILGNHDQGALFDPEGFSSGAERAIFWTRNQIEMLDGDAPAAAARWDFLAQLPRTHVENGLLFVHGSPRSPLNEYVFPEDVYNVKKIEKLFSLVSGTSFQGHTHVPGVFGQRSGFHCPQDIDHQYVIGQDKAMINVGSVGQPRDGDRRCCYIVLDGDLVTFRRVEYPVEQTVEKIYSIPELDNFLGDRLREGK